MSKLILFQGDSITDCGRNNNKEDITSTGVGYALMVNLIGCGTAYILRQWVIGLSKMSG